MKKVNHLSKLYTIPISENQRRAKEINDDTADALAQLGNDISAESAERVNADAELSAAIINLSGTVTDAVTDNNSAINSAKSELNSKIDNAITRIDTDIETLDANLLTETTRAKTRENEIETTLTQKIEAEQSARALADVNLTTQMKALSDTEIDARKKADDDLSAKIAKEISDRVAEDNSIKLTISQNVANLAPKNNPTFTGTPIVPAASDSTPDNQIANVKFVKDKVAEVNGKLVIFTKATSTADGKAGLVPAQGKTDKKQILTSDGWANMDAAGMTLAVPTQNGKLTYNRNQQSPSWNNYDPAKIKIEVTAQTNAGTYTAKATPLGLYVWSDTEKQESRDLSWTIDPLLLPKPSASVTAFTFNNNSQGITVANFDSTYITQTGTTSASDAGTYEATYSLKNTSNTKWSDNTTANVKLGWSIAILKIDKPSATGQTEFDYDKEIHAINITNFNETYLNRTGTISTADAGEYSVTISIKQTKNVHWKDDSTANVILSWKIVVRELEKPTLSVDAFTFSYANNNGTGTTHQISINNYDERFMTKSGTESASDAGVYSVTITLKDEKYSWKDKTKTAIVLTWRVNPAKVAVPTLSSETAKYTGGFIYIEMKDYGRNWLNGKPSGTSKSTWTTALGSGITSSGESAYVLNAGTYTFTVTPNKNHCWLDDSTTAKDFTFRVTKTTVTVPTIAGGGDFKNADYTITWTNFNSSLMTKSGTETAKNAGRYSVTVSLKSPDDYEWEGLGHSEPIILYWNVNRAKLSDTQSNLYQETPFTYSGNTLTFTPKNYDANIHVLSGTITAKNAGIYYATVDVDANHLWSDGTSDSKTVKWEVVKSGSVVKPTAPNTQFAYTGKKITLAIDGLNASYVKKTAGSTEATDVGGYSVTYELIDPDNFTWADGTSAPVLISWDIFMTTIDAPVISTREFTFDEKEHAPTFTSAFDSAHITIGGTTAATNASQYTITCSLKDKTTTVWKDTGDTLDKSFTWIINPQKLSATLSSLKQSGTLTYDGNDKTLTLTNFNAKYHVLSGTTSATEAGNYEATVSLQPNYAWSTGKTSPITAQWSIKKLSLTIPTVTSATKFTFDNTLKSLTFSNYNTTYIRLTGTTSAIDEKVYSCTFVLQNKTSLQWVTNSSDKTADITYSWSIEKTKIAMPTVADTELTYNLTKNVAPTITGFDSNTMVLAGDVNNNLKVGDFTLKIALKDKTMHKWANNSSDDLTFNYNVAKIKVSSPNAQVIGTSYSYTTYTGDEFNVYGVVKFTCSTTGTAYLFDEATYSGTNSPKIIKAVTGTKTASNAGVHSISITLQDICEWDDGTTGAKTALWQIKPKVIDPPSVSTENVFVYNEKSYSVMMVGYDSDTMTLGGVTSATDAGDYVVTVTPKSNWCWEGNNQTALSFYWHIENKPLSASLSKLSINQQSFTGMPKTITVNNSNDKYHTLDRTRPAALTTGNKLSVTKTYTETVDVYACKNYCFANGSTVLHVPVKWSKKVITGPTAKSGTYSNLAEDGTAKGPTLQNFDATFMEYTTDSTMTASAKGYYTIGVKLKTTYDQGDGTTVDIANTDILYWKIPDFDTFANGTREVSISDHDRYYICWAIGYTVLPLPYVAITWRYTAYTGSQISLRIANSPNSKYAEIFDNTATDKGDYLCWIYLNKQYSESGQVYWLYAENSKGGYLTSIVQIPWNIGDGKVNTVAMPEITSDDEFEYDGSEKSVTLSAFDGDLLTVSGTLSATHADTYIIKITPKEHVYWSDRNTQETRYLTWKITPQPLPQSMSVFHQSNVLYYDGKKKTAAFTGYNASYMNIRNISATECGTYYATIVTDSYDRCFNDYTFEKQVEWRIIKTFVLKPVITSATCYYANGENPVEFTNYDETAMTLTYRRGTTVVSGKNFIIGNYTATFSLKDSANNTWQDGSTADYVVNFTISLRKLTKPGAVTKSFEYTGNTINFRTYIYNFNTTYMTITGTTSAIDVNSYSVTIALKDTTLTSWSDGSTGNITITWNITRIKLSTAQSTFLSLGEVPITYKNGTRQLTPFVLKDGDGNVVFSETSYTITTTLTSTCYTVSDIRLTTSLGARTCKVTPNANYCWEDGSTDAKTVTWITITKILVPLPYISGDSSFEYDGTTRKLNVIADENVILKDGSGPTETSAPGTYQLKYALADRTYMEWEDQVSRSEYVLMWKITVSDLPKPTVNGNLTYTGNAQSPVLNGYLAEFMELSSQTSATDAGSYTIVVKLKDKVNTKWVDGTQNDVSLVWNITRQSVNIASTTALTHSAITYNAAAQSVIGKITSHPADYFNFTGTTSATNAGTYTITIAPKPNFAWRDGSVNAVSKQWSIGKGNPDFRITKPDGSSTLTAITINDSINWSNCFYVNTEMTERGGASANYGTPLFRNLFKIAYAGDGSVGIDPAMPHYGSSSPNIAYVYSATPSDPTLIVRGNGKVTISYVLNESANYKSATVSVDVTVNLTLNGMPWHVIQAYCSYGGGIERFCNIGDTKTISGSVKATLIGLAHNSDIESPIRTYGGGRQPLSHFAIFNADISMGHHDPSTNAGGWKDSDIRAYLNDTYLKSLPSDLQAVICAVGKYTDNVGGSTNTAANVTKTTDKIFIPAALECYVNARNYPNTSELNYQETYEYWANGNTCGMIFWTRSPGVYSQSMWTQFCYKNDQSRNAIGIGQQTARVEYYVVPCFAVGLEGGKF